MGVGCQYGGEWQRLQAFRFFPDSINSINLQPQKINNMKQLATSLNILGLITFFWVAMSHGSPPSVAPAIALPLGAILLSKSKNIIIWHTGKNDTRETVFFAIFFPAIGLGYIGFDRFFIDDHTRAFCIAAIAMVVLMAITLTISKEFDFRKIKSYLATLLISFFLLIYTYGSVVAINCIQDRTQPQTFNVQVLNKDKRTSRLPNYFLTLAPWHNYEKSYEVKVVEHLYNNVNIGETLSIELRKGRLGIAWYELSK